MKEAEKIQNRADAEVIGIFTRRNQAKADNARRAERQRLDQENEYRRQEEVAVEEEAECRHDLRQATAVAAAMSAVGALYIMAPHFHDVAYVVGGLFVATALTVFGIGLARWRWR